MGLTAVGDFDPEITDDGVPLGRSTLVGDTGLTVTAGCTFAERPCFVGTTFAGFPADV